MAEGCTVITGGDGYLGSWIAERCLSVDEGPVILWVRATDEGEFSAKRARLEPRFAHLGGGRVSYAWGDLTWDDPFRELAPGDVRRLIHSAAVTRFNVDQVTADRVNVQGTERLLAFASGCPSLQAVGLLSTVYSSGLRDGRIGEEPFDGEAGFANHYERSKWQAEDLLLTRYSALPWRIFRVATAIADDDSGAVSQQNAFHNTLKLFYYGLLSLVPGQPDTPVYLVTADFAAESIVHIMFHGTDASIYHVAHTREDSLPLGELVDVALRVFEGDEDFRSRRVLRPLFADLETFRMLADSVSAFGGGILGQAVGSMAPFAQQLFVHKDIRNDRLVAALPDYQPPDARSLIERAVRFLVENSWGRTAVHVA